MVLLMERAEGETEIVSWMVSLSKRPATFTTYSHTNSLTGSFFFGLVLLTANRRILIGDSF